jgi:hypothetical protein
MNNVHYALHLREVSIAAQLVQRTRAGRVVRQDPRQIADAVCDYYQTWKQGCFEHDLGWDLITQFSRRNLTGRLAAEFNNLTSGEDLR